MPEPQSYVTASARGKATLQSLDSLPLFMAGQGAMASLPPPVARRPQPFRVALWGGVVAVFAAGAVASTLSSRKADWRAPSTEATAAVVEMAPVRQAIDHMSAQKAVVEAFFAAGTVEEKLPLIRGGERLRDAVVDYYRAHPDEETSFDFVDVLAGHHGEGFSLIRGRDVTGNPVDVLVEDTGAGYRVDWRFITGAGDMGWEQWLHDRPAVPVSMRVEAEPGDFYAPPYQDSVRWLCLRVADRARQHSAWAYLDRSNPAASKMARVLELYGSLRLTGEFVFPEAQAEGPPLMELRTVLPHGWRDDQTTSSTVAAAARN